MTLHPTARIIVDQMTAAFPPPDPSLTGTDMRALIKERAGDVIPSTVEEVASVDDREIPGPLGTVPVRIYRPAGTAPDAVLPLVVFFHGGGWVVCDLDSHDGLCRTIANDSGCSVVAVHYRRAPEDRFPAAVEDCYAAFAWLAEHAGEIGCDPDRVAVVGDSAGGNLAAAVALMARDREGPAIALQVLIYPITDHAFDTPSHLGQGTTNGLTSAEVQYYWGEYLNDSSEADDYRASPLRAESHADLPPALLVLPEHDPLRSEGEAYGAALQAAGVQATVTVYEGMFHSFLMFKGTLDAADEALAKIADALHGVRDGLAT